MFAFDWSHVAADFLRIVAAFLFALPIGWEREREEHGAGVRTFPLVAMASCEFVLLGENVPNADAAAQSRIIQGMITGIGFIGGGAVFRSDGGVHGTATAASIWMTGLMGAAVAQGRYDIGVLLTVLNLITLRLLYPLKKRLDTRANGEPK